MSGFYLEVLENQDRFKTPAPRLVDLGECEREEAFHAGNVRGAWTYWKGSHHWRTYRDRDRLLVMEGQPDRWPEPGEPLSKWLPGRWGSYRGFEIVMARQPGEAMRVSAFVDPLSTRPLFYMKTPGGGVSISDKLSTLAVNSGESVSVNWGAVLEAMVVGSLYSPGTSLQCAEQFVPGECIEFQSGNISRRYKHELQTPSGFGGEQVRKDPAGTLLKALELSVGETWTDQEAHLLLSGGLDSRLVLALAGSSRKTLTVANNVEHEEFSIAKDIAHRCGARFRAWPFPPENHYTLLKDGFLLTGALADSKFIYNLPMALGWRREGVGAIVHAYLFDTVLKGWPIYPHHEVLGQMNSLFDLIGKTSNCAKLWSSRGSQSAADDIFRLLSQDGQQLVMTHLKELVAQLDPVVENGLDLTLERLSLRRPSKINDYYYLLGAMESVDVSSPIFHPALWAWHNYSHPHDRYRGKAFRRVLRTLKHPVSEIIDGNTGKPLAEVAYDWRIPIRRLPGYALLRQILHRRNQSKTQAPTVTPSGKEPIWPRIPPVLRTGRGMELIRQGLSGIAGNPLFDHTAIEDTLQRFLDGNDALHEPVLAAMTAGQWSALAAKGGEYTGRGVRQINASHTLSAGIK